MPSAVIRISIISCLLAAAWPAASGEPGPSVITPSARLKADFRMTRTLRVLKDSVQSSGRLVLGGAGLLRWETLSPARSVLIVNGKKGWLHYPDLKVTKGFDVSSDPVMKVLSEHLLALTTGNFEAVSSMYDVQAVDATIKELVPKSGEIEKLFEKMRVKASTIGVISEVVLVSKSGDTTTIVFSNVETNPKLSEGLFEKPGEK
jgi:outer membrane lipoprotein carrier protein